MNKRIYNDAPTRGSFYHLQTATLAETDQARARIIGTLKLLVQRLSEYPDAEGGVALEGGRRLLKELAP